MELKSIQYCLETGRIYWGVGDCQCYAEPVYDGDDFAYWDVYYVPEYGGRPQLDSHCDTLRIAIQQLEKVST